MKKILVLSVLISFYNNVFAQNSTIDGALYGMNKDVYIINYDRSTSVDAGIRLSTLSAGYKSWNIFNEREDGKLHFSFSQSSSHNDVGSRRMTLRSNGNLGLGTTSPAQRLDVRGGAYISHNVGIGTTNPTYKLHAKGDVYADGGWVRVSGQRGIYFQSYGGGFYMTDNTWIRTYNNKSFYHNSGTMRTDGTFQVGNGGSRFLVKTDGKVGIGTTSPGYKLDVSGDIRANNGWIRSQGDYGLYNNSDGTYFYSDDANYWRLRSDRGLRIDNRSGTRKGYVYHDNSNGFGLLDGDGNWGLRLERDSYTSFHINNSEKMRILSSGSVGIGTTSPTAKLHLRGSRADFYIQNTSVTDWAFMRIQGSGSNFWDIGQYGDNDYLEFRPKGASNGNRVVIKQSGHVGIGTTSPAEKLSVIGKLSLANSADETSDYIQLYHDGEANLSTKEGALHFRKVDDKYLVAEQLSNSESRIYSVGKDLMFKARMEPVDADPADAADVYIKADDGMLVANKGTLIKGNVQIENLDPGEDDDYVLSLNENGDILKMRSVESLTPWVIRQVTEELSVLSCNPHAEGEECTCEGGHISIESDDIIDIEGNLMLGLQGYIDNDMEPGLNDGDAYSDDYIKVQGAIEFGTSNANKGLVLRDYDAVSSDFLNLFHKNGVSYFSNTTNGDISTDYFMKIGGFDIGEKNLISFKDKVNFENGFVTPVYSSPDQMTFALDTDNTNTDALFQVGRGTQNASNETNWFGLFSVDQSGLATFSSDIGDTSNPNRVSIDGAVGRISMNGGMSIGGTEESPNAQIDGDTGNANFIGKLEANEAETTSLVSGRITTSLPGGSEAKAMTVFNTTDNAEVFRVYNTGIVEAKEVLVSLDVWHDEVFEEEYDLMPVEELEDFVNENHHLPEIPAEEEVISKGVNVGQMEALLLKKIEELTLYVIDQNKKLEAQSSRIQELENKLK